MGRNVGGVQVGGAAPKSRKVFTYVEFTYFSSIDCSHGFHVFIPKRLALDKESKHEDEELLADTRGSATPASSGVTVDWNKLFSKSSK